MSPLLPVLLAASTDSLVVGLLVDPVTLDPHRATDLVSAAVVANTCDTLVSFGDRRHRPQAALATTWATVDNRTWTFTLREGVRFHDGARFDASAVAANIERLRRAQAFPGRARRLGPYVVAIELERPSAALLATLSQPFFSMVSPLALASGPRPIGTGPFRLVTARPGLVELAANPAHWGGPPRLAQLLFRRYADESALLAALRRNEVDVSSAVSQRRIDSLRALDGLDLDSRTGLNIAFLSVNNERAPFDDVRVRQALARAIDRQALVDGILGGHGEPARNPLPPALFGYARETRELSLDRTAARRLLAEAGHPDGFETTLLSVKSTRPYMPDPERLSASIRDELARVGVRASLVQVTSWAAYVERGSRGDYDLMPLGWQADTTDPNDFLTALLSTPAVGATNRSRYSSRAMDAILKRGRMAPDAASRSRAYADAQQLFQREMPWIPLYHVASFTVQRSAVRGLAIGATGILRYDRAWKTE
jgi:peptide/nickel transport system substrate-binding protein